MLLLASAFGAPAGGRGLSEATGLARLRAAELECPHGSDGMIVKMKADVSARTADPTAALARKCNAGDEVTHSLRSLSAIAGKLSEATLNSLLADDEIESVVPDCIVQLDDVAALQEDATWGIDRIDARSGLDGTFDDSKYTGEGTHLLSWRKVGFFKELGGRIVHISKHVNISDALTKIMTPSLLRAALRENRGVFAEDEYTQGQRKKPRAEQTE